MKKRVSSSSESRIAVLIEGKAVEFPKMLPLNEIIGLPKLDGVNCYIPAQGVIRKEYPSKDHEWYLARVKVGEHGWTKERMDEHSLMIEVLGPTTVMPGTLVDFIVFTYKKKGRMRTILQTEHVFTKIKDPRPRVEVEVIVDRIAKIGRFEEAQKELQKAPESMRGTQKEKKHAERRGWMDGES